MEDWVKMPNNLDLSNIEIKEIHIKRPSLRNVLVILVCNSAAQSHKLKLLLDSNEILLQVLNRENKIILRLEFYKSLQEIDFVTNKEQKEFFDFQWLIEQTANFLTVGFRSNSGEIKWQNHYISLWRTGEAADRLGFN